MCLQCGGKRIRRCVFGFEEKGGGRITFVGGHIGLLERREKADGVFISSREKRPPAVRWFFSFDTGAQYSGSKCACLKEDYTVPRAMATRKQ